MLDRIALRKCVTQLSHLVLPAILEDHLIILKPGVTWELLLLLEWLNMDVEVPIFVVERLYVLRELVFTGFVSAL